MSHGTPGFMSGALTTDLLRHCLTILEFNRSSKIIIFLYYVSIHLYLSTWRVHIYQQKVLSKYSFSKSNFIYYCFIETETPPDLTEHTSKVTNNRIGDANRERNYLPLTATQIMADLLPGVVPLFPTRVSLTLFLLFPPFHGSIWEQVVRNHQPQC